ncbi:unnamed protein product [Psylliodes chrysocephalus]|uniref:Pre-C2HC domain-containing protein n=1 Tax=Psylliodes chrysocephalus TaxID=3402493 RepID=A0A9P0DED4_9CUCU|nr:unnamed protein product [Psylliodes chrysocephala]
MIKKIKDGLLIETVSAAQTKRLLAIQKQHDMDVEVQPHKSLNKIKGVIYCPDLLNSTVDEILDDLKLQGVVSVYRNKSKKDGQLVDTPIHVLTFTTSILPKTVKVSFYSLPVRLYIPQPMRCFRYQKFGHTSMRYDKPQVCVCGKLIICINCNGTHSARSRMCPVYKQEMAIQEIKTKNNISYTEAKKKVIIPTPRQNTSYSQATSSLPHSTEQLIKNLIPVLIHALKSQFTIIPNTNSQLSQFSDDPRN